jgi:hypothetical protein
MNNGKAKIEKRIDGLNIEIPSKKNWFALIFGLFWLFIWFNFFLVPGEFQNFGTDSFPTIWLLLWILGVLSVIFCILWGLFGQELFNDTRNDVVFEKTIFGIGIKKRFEKTEIKNFRVEAINQTMFGGNRWAFWGLGPGKIKFDYGLKTYSFGLGVDDAEANYIVEMLKEHFNKQ